MINSSLSGLELLTMMNDLAIKKKTRGPLYVKVKQEQPHGRICVGEEKGVTSKLESQLFALVVNLQIQQSRTLNIKE